MGGRHLEGIDTAHVGVRHTFGGLRLVEGDSCTGTGGYGKQHGDTRRERECGRETEYRGDWVIRIRAVKAGPDLGFKLGEGCGLMPP